MKMAPFSVVLFDNRIAVVGRLGSGELSPSGPTFRLKKQDDQRDSADQHLRC